MRTFRKTTARYTIGKMRIPVRVRVPKQPLVVNGAARDALSGIPGSTIGCAISNMMFREVKTVEGYSVVAPPEVTSRRLLIPIKLDKDGIVCDCLQYEH